MNRYAGILMPIFSLPSNYGIGTMGKEAYKFIDFLKSSKQSYWQILPIGPTSTGNSPYSTYSIYAGNPYFIDIDELIEEGLIKRNLVAKYKTINRDYINYDFLCETKFNILFNVYLNSKELVVNEFDQFKKENELWLDDYALFMSIKKKYNNISWIEWPDKDIKFRKLDAINKYKKELEENIDFYKFIQYLFYKQFNRLKNYANINGIKIIGDIPFYVPLDSVECWSNPESFELNDEYIPTIVSGVPPDYFSKTGQLWGNPIYNWEYMRNNGYKWWIDRIGQASKIYDVIRLDHFRGFESYWAVPYGDKNAINGKWIKGPDMDVLEKLKGWFNNVEFIAEDLGYITPEVRKTLNDFGFPGMKVMQFSFNIKNHDGPYTYPENSVCYVGTHDNSTALGFEKTASKKEILYCKEYLNHSIGDEFNWTLIKGGMATKSKIFICQMQDYLGLDDSARINIPGTTKSNWQWRMKKNSLTKKLSKKIAKYTSIYGRG